MARSAVIGARWRPRNLAQRANPRDCQSRRTGSHGPRARPRPRRSTRVPRPPCGQLRQRPTTSASGAADRGPSRHYHPARFEAFPGSSPHLTPEPVARRQQRTSGSAGRHLRGPGLAPGQVPLAQGGHGRLGGEVHQLLGHGGGPAIAGSHPNPLGEDLGHQPSIGN